MSGMKFFYNPGLFLFRLGAHRRVSVVGTEQDIRVSKVIQHPQYHQPKRYSNDIALLKLERPAQLNRYYKYYYWKLEQGNNN